MPLESMTQAYRAIANIASPNPMQRAVWESFERQDDYGISLLVKAGTGVGKTEAIAAPSLWTQRRLIMVYPTRSLVDDQAERLMRYLAAWSDSLVVGGRVVTLTIDTGAQSQRHCWRAGQRWSTGQERAGRHLYYGDVIITTLDKFLYRFFGFGEPKKSYIYPLRIRHMKNPLICFDEAHSYESEAFTNFERLVRMLVEKGKDVVLMTATMPPELEALFASYLETLDFTTGQGEKLMAEWRQARSGRTFQPGKQLQYIPVPIVRKDETGDSPATERMIREVEQRVAVDRRLIVTFESVKEAASAFQRLERTIHEVPVRLYHGRLTQTQRSKVYSELKQRNDDREGYVLVSTSAIEVGCDLDAHVLITQLCDPDRLIQRAGRCNRREEMDDAVVIVVGNDIPEWATALPPDARAIYMEALQANDNRDFNPAVFIPYIQKRLDPDPRVAVMFDMLYEYVYESRLENKQLYDNGLVITRSWEPSITLYQGEERGRLLEPVSVPISRCRVLQDQEPTPLLNGGVFKQTYNVRTHSFDLSGLGRWENAYRNDIVVCWPEYTYANGSPFRAELGYVDLPLIFRGPYPRGPRVIMQYGVEPNAATIWYIDPKRLTNGSFDGVFQSVIAPVEDVEDAAVVKEAGDE